MTPNARSFIERTVREHKPSGPVCEFGSLRVPEQDTLANLRPLFPNFQYVGCDMRNGTGVDTIEDIHATKFDSNIFSTIVCADTLEHVESPHQALIEIYRILKPGGLLIITSVFCFPIHNHPNDYWRFTPSAFRLLLAPFAKSAIFFDGNPLLPIGIYGWAIK